MRPLKMSLIGFAKLLAKPRTGPLELAAIALAPHADARSENCFK
jgi:hypothetical protein